MSRLVTTLLGSHYEEFIQRSLDSGRYNNISEVIRAGLRRLEEDEYRMAALREGYHKDRGLPVVLDGDTSLQIPKRRPGRKKKTEL